LGVLGFNIILILITLLHPVHVSVTNVEYKTENELFEVSFKIFYDDFETIIAHRYNVQLYLGLANERKDKDVYFTKYVTDNFTFIADGDFLLPEFRSGKINENSIWLYYTYSNTADVSEIIILNRLMMDLFDDQTNLLLFKYGSFEKGYSVKRGKEKIVIDLGNV